MTLDEILQMAEQCDFDWSLIGIDALETFANLVAARERDDCIEDVRCVGGDFSIAAEATIRARWAQK